ncbi:MAG: hypothetical protein MUP52_03395 [Candidatus Aminicenantes bacterium]|jgi:hypothetical protein|nr:hypothetical protein [Candidatus Aminicenantes bacterium]
MKIKLFVFLCLCFSFISCATAPVPRQVQTAFPIDKAFDKVWQAVIETFAELNLPILNKEIGPGVISTDWINLENKDNTNGYCDCGKLGIMAIEDLRHGRFEVYIKKVGDSSCELKVNTEFELIWRSIPPVYTIGGEATFTKKCVSTGILEAEIFKRVSEKTK